MVYINVSGTMPEQDEGKEGDTLDALEDFVGKLADLGLEVNSAYATIDGFRTNFVGEQATDEDFGDDAGIEPRFEVLSDDQEDE